MDLNLISIDLLEDLYLVCEAGQHDLKYNYNGKNIAELLHEKTGLPVEYTEDSVGLILFFGPFLKNSPTAQKHGWQWLK